MKKLIWLLVGICMLVAIGVPVTAAPEIADLRVDATPARDWREMVAQSDLVIVGKIDGAYHKFETGRSIEARRIVNYVQTIQLEHGLLGTPPRPLSLLSTGVEPLPDRSHRLNLNYPGPLAEGQYVLFLKKVRRSDLYSTVGLWQGIYPVYDGKTITLEGQGFPELNQLTIAELRRKINQNRR